MSKETQLKVKLTDYTRPADVIVARAALASYWDDWSIENAEKITEKDAEIHVPKILSYGHESVLEHVNLSFEIEGCSRVCSHQLVRHRHMSFVQRSQRYIGADSEYIIPPAIKKNPEWMEKFEKIMNDSLEFYEELVKAGVAKQEARYIVPQAISTKFYVTMNFREFKHFMGLRACARADWEIQQVAWKMLEEVVKHDDLRKLVEWAKVGPRCVQLGYCPERELMPKPNCVIEMKKKVEKLLQ